MNRQHNSLPIGWSYHIAHHDVFDERRVWAINMQLQICLMYCILRIASIRICVMDAGEPELIPLTQNKHDKHNEQNEAPPFAFHWSLLSCEPKGLPHHQVAVWSQTAMANVGALWLYKTTWLWGQHCRLCPSSVHVFYHPSCFQVAWHNDVRWSAS